MSDEKKEEKREVKIFNDESLKRVYANYISAVKTCDEFNLTFCCIDPLDVKGARTVAKIAIPNSIIENALKEMEEEFKNPKKPPLPLYISEKSVY
jgi:deoxyadenosine/deoxycytidine kinase